MSKKEGYSRPGLFGNINHTMKKAAKQAKAVLEFLVGMWNMTARGIKQVKAILECLAE